MIAEENTKLMNKKTKKTETFSDNDTKKKKEDFSLTKKFQLPMDAGKKTSKFPSKKRIEFTEVYHNYKPFFVEMMSKLSTRCSHCGLDMPWRNEVPPFNIVFRHSERWSYKDKESNELHTTYKTHDAYYHAKYDCINKRFPYFDSSFVQITAQARANLTTSHFTYLNEEFSLSIPVK